MAESLGTATLELEGDLSKLEKDLDKARSDAESKGQKAGAGFGTKFSGGLKRATLPALAVLGAVAVGAKKTIDAATDLGESQNAVNVVFEEGADKLHAFAKTADTEVGLSMRAVNELVTPVGAQLRNVGFSADEAADASINLAKRAADMASVFNTDVSEAMMAIQAGLRGEADPLERFGVGLSAAAVEAEALSMGLVKTKVDMKLVREQQEKLALAQKAYTAAVKEHGEKSDEARKAKLSMSAADRSLAKTLKGSKVELDDNAKMQARLSLFTKQTARVEGDFVNTSDSAANAARIQAAQTENLSAKIGQGLLPIYQSLQRMLLSVTGLLGQHTTAVTVGTAVVAALAASVLVLRGAMAVYSAGAAVATAATWLFSASATKAGKVSRAAAAAQWLWNVALLANPIVLIIAAIVAFGVALVVAYKKSERFRAVVSAAIDFVKRHWQLLLLALGPFGLAIAKIITHWGTLRDKGVAALNRVKAVVNTVRGAFVSAFNAMQGPIIRVIGWVRSLVEAIQGAISWVNNLRSKVGQALPDPTPGFDVPGVPFFDSGGVMPGPRGAHRLALVAGGETILPTHKPGFAGGGQVVFNFPRYVGNRRELVADLRLAVNEHRRANGGADPW